MSKTDALHYMAHYNCISKHFSFKDKKTFLEHRFNPNKRKLNKGIKTHLFLVHF